MKKNILIVSALMLGSISLQAQKYFTKNGHISFFSKTSMENIKAVNDQVMNVLNVQTGELQFSVLIKSFHFEKALMEEHFNENYLESEKFPKSIFKGNISNLSEVNFTKDGQYPVSVTGSLTLHGVTKPVTSTGKIVVTAGKISASSLFNIRLADYNISIPKLVKDNIAESVEITVLSDYDQKM